MQNNYENLSKQLPLTGALYGLDTAEMEALTALESTVMASPSQNSIQRMTALVNGSTALSKTMDNPAITEALIAAMMQTHELVRYAAIVRPLNRKAGIAIYFGRD